MDDLGRSDSGESRGGFRGGSRIRQPSSLKQEIFSVVIDMRKTGRTQLDNRVAIPQRTATLHGPLMNRSQQML